MTERRRARSARHALPLVALFSVVLVGAGACGTTVLDPGATITAAAPDAGTVAATVERPKDPSALASALETDGVVLPPGTNVYAATVIERRDEIRYREFEAGGGSLSVNFWPASSVKLLAAVGALEFLGDLGFTGSALVTYEDGSSWFVRDLYEAAIASSSNEAYDQLVEIAGVDWLNTVFLTPERGFPESVIETSYTGLEDLSSPPMTITEGDRQVSLPERPAAGPYGTPDAGNRSNLRELTESVRRVMLDAHLPESARFDIDRADVALLAQALSESDGFIRPGAQAVLHDDALVFDKPGYVEGLDCVDVGYVEDPHDRASYLLGISIPDDGLDCTTVTVIAQRALTFLQERS